MSLGSFNKSNNPLLSEKSFAKIETIERRAGGPILDSSFQMTVSGAVNKTLLLSMIAISSFIVAYSMPSTLMMWGGFGVGLITLIVASFKRHLSPVLAPIFAIGQGLFAGSISYVYAMQFEGIIFQAASLTFATLLAMLLIYKSGIIKVTRGFRTAISMAVSAIMLVYLVNLAGMFFNFEVPYLHESSPLGIGISLVIVGIASLNLLLDFDNFEKGEQMGAPKYMEWFFGMSLLFTIIWLYLEILRLLAKLQRD